MVIDLYALMVFCFFDSTGVLLSGTSEKGLAKLSQRREETSKEPSERLRLVLFASLLSISHKGKHKLL